MNLFTASLLRLSLVSLGATSVPNRNIRCNWVCSWFTMLTMLLLGKAASPRPGRPSHVGLGGAEDEDNEEVGLRDRSSLLSPRSWTVWVSMIDGTCPHRSHPSPDVVWILRVSEIHFCRGRLGLWICHIAMVDETYLYRKKHDRGSALIPMNDGFLHRLRRGPWSVLTCSICRCLRHT